MRVVVELLGYLAGLNEKLVLGGLESGGADLLEFVEEDLLVLV